ncbi:ribosome biogenesis GTPase YlqF [Acidaminococcus timonensis]|uniref:ribosome biogenesis GTPase YlqF n=2 Tax=Acidaminococcus timonensis TaxID=1871002 RepID=UPI00307AA62B
MENTFGEKKLHIQWFPGHMTKARRMMEANLKLVDVVVELLDARIPRSSANPMLQQLIGSKQKIVVLNKTDMADPDQTRAWLTWLKKKNFTALEVDCQKGRGVKALVTAIQKAGEPTLEKWRKKGVRNRSIRVMIVGIPNVGKSTLINRLLGRNKTVTQNKPGVTRGPQWVILGKGLELLDTPGVLWPKFDNPETGFCLAVTGAIREEVFDQEIAVHILVQRLMKRYPQELCANYKIELTTEDTVETVEEKIALSRGWLQAGGVADKNKTIQMVLRDFKSGKLGAFTLEIAPKTGGEQ